MREYYQQRATDGLIIREGTWVSADGQGWLGRTRNLPFHRVQLTKTGQNDLTKLINHQKLRGKPKLP